MSPTNADALQLSWPYWPQSRQRESWDNMAPYKTATVNGYGAAKFGGKAQPLDANLLTPYGWKQMGEIKVGSQLVHPDGGVQSVIQVHPQGVKDVYKVKLADGGETEVCADHLWKCTFGPAPTKKDEDSTQWQILDTKTLIKTLNISDLYPFIPLPDPVTCPDNSELKLSTDLRRIVSIEPSRKAEAQCITVNNVDGLYITDDFIVTHNSYNIRAICCMYGMDRPLQMAIFAREYDQLKDLHIEPIKAEMAQYIEAGLLKWNANDKQFRFTETGALLKFIQVNRPSDMIKHNGKGFDIVCVDEAQQFTEFELSFLPSLCRTSAVAMAHKERIRRHYRAAETKQERKQLLGVLEDTFYHPKCLMCFNWGDAGHNYLVSKFWEGCSHRKSPQRDLSQFDTDPDSVTGDMREDPDDFTFIFASWEDNKKGYEDNPEYIKSLNRLPEPYRTAFKEGDPYAMSGLKYQIVDGIHEVDMDEILEPYDGYVPEHWRLLGALDPGTASPCAFSLYAIDPKGNKYQLTDYYKSGFSFEENVDNIWNDIKHCRWTRNGQVPDYIIAGKDAFHRKSRYAIHAHDVTLADIFWDKYRLSLTEANTDRRLGAMAVAGALSFRMDEESDKPRFLKTPNLYFACYREKVPGDEQMTRKIQVCKATKDELTALKSDQHDPEDIQRGDNIDDHAFDKTKYFLLGSNKPHQMSQEVQERYEHSDYGRHPEEKVWEKEKPEEKSLNDTFADTPLAETI